MPDKFPRGLSAALTSINAAQQQTSHLGPCPETSMPTHLYLRALAVWFGLLLLAILNGAVREFVLAPSLGAAALPLSGLTAIAAFTIAIALFVRWTRPSVGTAPNTGRMSR